MKDDTVLQIDYNEIPVRDFDGAIPDITKTLAAGITLCLGICAGLLRS